MTAESSLSAVLKGFISLGINCEFGLVQRYCGVEPNDLFRFGISPLRDLIGQLDSRFSDFLDQSKLEFRPDDAWHEFLSGVFGTGIGFHTNLTLRSKSMHDVVKQEIRRLPLLARKLMAELEAGERCCVYSGGNLTEADALSLHDALLRYGPVRLLIVTNSVQDDDVGTVRKIREGLLFGYLDQVTPRFFARQPSLDVWLALLVVARAMFRYRTLLGPGSVVRAGRDAFLIPDEVQGAVRWRTLAALRSGDYDTTFLLYNRHADAFDPEDDMDAKLSRLLLTRQGLLAADRVYRRPIGDARWLQPVASATAG